MMVVIQIVIIVLPPLLTTGRVYVLFQLQDYLLQRISSLIQCSDSDFWRRGRFLVHTGQHLASHKDGRHDQRLLWLSVSLSWSHY